MSDQLICNICGDVIEYPKDKKQIAHDYCVFAEDASKTFDNLGKNHHKANALTVIKKLALALTGLEPAAEGGLTQEAVRDCTIINYNKLIKTLESAFDVDLGENKTDIISKKFEMLQPFFRIETISRELGFQKPHTMIGVIYATYSQSRKNLHVPKTWDTGFLKHGISPSYIRTGKGDVFLTENEKKILELQD